MNLIIGKLWRALRGVWVSLAYTGRLGRLDPSSNLGTPTINQNSDLSTQII